MPSLPHATIYTDGACIGNPGPGGYGVVLNSGSRRREASGGFSPTTNNRMEIYAAIVGLRMLTKPTIVTLFSDSKYLVDAVNKGWLQRWHANRWQRTKRKKLENVDLWKQLLPLLKNHQVTFHWVKGHAGDPENERCDRLANKAAAQPGLPPDSGYQTSSPQSTML